MDYKFSRYVPETQECKLPLMHLILHKYDLSKINLIEQVNEDSTCNMKVRKMYGITEEHVDFKKIYRELQNTINPIICDSKMCYECYAKDKEIYMYTPNERKIFNIEDMSIISPLMLIEENCIISSNEIIRDEQLPEKIGFSYFKEYVINSYIEIENWTIEYTQDKNFNVTWKDANGSDIMLLSTTELAKSETYQMVIYIINNLQDEIEGIEEQAYNMKKYRLVV